MHQKLNGRAAGERVKAPPLAPAKREERDNVVVPDAALALSISCDLSSLPACKNEIRSSYGSRGTKGNVRTVQNFLSTAEPTSKLCAEKSDCADMLISVSDVDGNDGCAVNVGRWSTICIGRFTAAGGGIENEAIRTVEGGNLWPLKYAW